MILLFFSARQKEIKNGICKWSPCIIYFVIWESEYCDEEDCTDDGFSAGLKTMMNLKKSSLFSLERWITAEGGAQKQELEKFGKSLNLKAQLVSPLVKVPPTLVM